MYYRKKQNKTCSVCSQCNWDKHGLVGGSVSPTGFYLFTLPTSPATEWLVLKNHHTVNEEIYLKKSFEKAELRLCYDRSPSPLFNHNTTTHSRGILGFSDHTGNFFSSVHSGNMSHREEDIHHQSGVSCTLPYPLYTPTSSLYITLPSPSASSKAWYIRTILFFFF